MGGLGSGSGAGASAASPDTKCSISNKIILVKLWGFFQITNLKEPAVFYTFCKKGLPSAGAWASAAGASSEAGAAAAIIKC